MLLVSTGFKVAILGRSSFADIFNDGELRIFAGVRPNNANAGEPSQPIGVVTRIGAATLGLQFIQVAEYVVRLPSDRWQLNTLQPGTPTWFRLTAPGDIFADSITAARIDGDVGAASTPNDMTLSVSTFTANTALPFDSFLYTIPPLAGI